MPRSNRYIQPGYVYHLTHRCHNRQYLLHGAKDRTEYCRRLREAARACNISLFDFCVTCNHVHLVVMCDRIGDLSRFMQILDGGFAEYLNRRKKRSGAVWGGRFHSTMVDGGDHLWNCLRYVDLNMVRASAVAHPREWEWCGYRELVGERKRFCLLDVDRLLELLGVESRELFIEMHEERIVRRIREQHLEREGFWTESIAVGSEAFLADIAAKTKWRARLRRGKTEEGMFYIREDMSAYSVFQSSAPPMNPEIRLLGIHD